MELINEYRNGIKESITKWLEGREWSAGECYPFQSTRRIEDDMILIMGGYGILYKGIETFGETLTFGGEWESEGLSIEINVNPNQKGIQFRVLWRWR
jgi:hypothetical protein